MGETQRLWPLLARRSPLFVVMVMHATHYWNVPDRSACGGGHGMRLGMSMSSIRYGQRGIGSPLTYGKENHALQSNDRRWFLGRHYASREYGPSS